jgi:hypothetical protein
MKRSIAAKLIRDEPTTNRLGERDGDIAGMCAYVLSEDKGCRAVCDREALAQTSFRSRSRCACSSGLSTLSSAVTTSRAWPNGRQAAFTGVDATRCGVGVETSYFDWCPHAESGVAPAVLWKISLYSEDRVGELVAARVPGGASLYLGWATGDQAYLVL